MNLERFSVGSSACFLLFILYILVFLSPLGSYYFSPDFYVWQLYPAAAILFGLSFFKKIKLHELAVVLLVFYSLLSCLIFYFLFEAGGFGAAALFSFSAIAFLVALSVFGRAKQEVLFRAYSSIVCLVFFYAIFQFLSYKFNWAIVDEEIYRGRSGRGFKQVTSFFYEPAFLGLFSLAFLYYALFVSRKYNLLLISLCIVVTILSRSVSAIFSSVAMLSIFYALQLERRHFLVSFFVFIPLVLSLLVYFDIFDILFGRLYGEVFGSLKYLSQEYLGHVESSGQVRIIGEINYFVNVAINSPIFGYGVDYNIFFSDFSAERDMSLNGFVEIFVRWGGVGCFVFFLFVVVEKVKYKPKSYFAFMAFIVLYFTSDGAISKVEFWLPIAIVLGFERIAAKEYCRKIQELKPSKS